MIKSYSIIDILNHIDPEINPEDHLIVFDIDNTVVESIDQLASTQWFEAMIKFKMEQESLTNQQALEKTLPLNLLLLKHSLVKPVEHATVEIIKQLQDKQHKVIALTARSPESLKECTIDHLIKVDIDFNRANIHGQEIIFNTRIHYSNGIIFTDGDHKGDALFTLLNTIGYKPKKIIFVDDKEHNHHAIKKTFKDTTIEHICIWYRYCEDKELQFDLAFTHGRLLYLCEQHPEVEDAYQTWLKPTKV